MNTGLPTILGWDYHVHQRAHDWAAIEQRKADLARLYQSARREGGAATSSTATHVRYVYVGDLEQRHYGEGVPRGSSASRTCCSPSTATRACSSWPRAPRVNRRRSGGAALPVALPSPPPGRLREPRAVAVDDEGDV